MGVMGGLLAALPTNLLTGNNSDVARYINISYILGGLGNSVEQDVDVLYHGVRRTEDSYGLKRNRESETRCRHGREVMEKAVQDVFRAFKSAW